VIVACVLRQGGRYTGGWVRHLQAGVDRHLSSDYRLVCLSNWHLSGVNTRLLAHDWPGWWSKIELFRPGLFEEPVLYLDLDTYVVGPLDEIASYRGPFAMLEDFLRPDGYGSGVMAFTPGEHTEAIYHRFCRDPARHQNSFRGHGDQAFIADTVEKIEVLQNLYPGRIVSYKADDIEEEGLDEEASVLCFHGEPKPDTLDWPDPDRWR